MTVLIYGTKINKTEFTKFCLFSGELLPLEFCNENFHICTIQFTIFQINDELVAFIMFDSLFSFHQSVIDPLIQLRTHPHFLYWQSDLPNRFIINC